MSETKLFLVMDVQKRLPNEAGKLRRFFERLSRQGGGEVRACHEANGVGYVPQRLVATWGHHWEVVASSM